MNEHDDGCMDEARETVRKRWLWRNQKAFSSPAKAALLGEADEDEEEARLQRAILRERERVAREQWEKKMKGDEGNRTKHPMAMLLPKREARADVITPSTSTMSSASSTQPAEVTPRDDKKKTKKGKKEEEAKESSLGDSRKEKERRTKAAPTKTLSYNVNLHGQVRLRKVQSFVYSSDERSPTSMGLVSKEKRKSAAEREKQEKKESKKKQKQKQKKQKQKRVGKSKDDSFILRPTTVAGGRPTRSASDASAVTPRLLSMISKPLDEDDVMAAFDGNNALDCTQTVALGPDLAQGLAAATDFEERSRMLALHRAQQRATWVPPLDMAKLAPPTTTTTSSRVRSPDSTIWSSSQSSSSSSSWSSCDLSPCTSSSTNVLSPSARSTPTTPGSPTSSGSKRSGVMGWLHLRRKRGHSRGQSLPVRASRSDSNSSSSGLDANEEETEDDQEEATATAATTTAAVATTAIAIKAKLAGGLSGRRRRGMKQDEERALFPGSAMAFVRREARYAVGLP